MREFADAGLREARVEVPRFTSPLTQEKEKFLFSIFDASSVTLSNLQHSYVMVKNWIIQTIENRI